MVKLAVIFPGIGYHCDKPLLYYARKLAADAGYEIVEIRYHDMPKKIKGDPERMNQAYLLALSQTKQILDGKDLSVYDDILFISKSIGTAVAAGYAKKYDLKVRHIFFTPLEGTFRLLAEDTPCIVFHGTKDPWAEDLPIREACREHQCPEYAYSDANHSIETGDVQTDIANLAEIMKIVEEALKEEWLSGVWRWKDPELIKLSEERVAQIEKRRNSKAAEKQREEVEERMRFIRENNIDVAAWQEEIRLRPPE